MKRWTSFRGYRREPRRAGRRSRRGWSQEDWDAATGRLRERGLLDATGELTERGVGVARLTEPGAAFAQAALTAGAYPADLLGKR